MIDELLYLCLMFCVPLAWLVGVCVGREWSKRRVLLWQQHCEYYQESLNTTAAELARVKWVLQNSHPIWNWDTSDQSDLERRLRNLGAVFDSEGGYRIEENGNGTADSGRGPAAA